LNKKWAEGKTELSEHKNELDYVRDELKNKSQNVTRITVDMDSRLEASVLKKKHEETQGMLRGVTESLLKATEKLQNERKARKSLEAKFHEANFNLNLNADGSAPGPAAAGNAAVASAGSIDFASLRSAMNTDTKIEESDARGNDGGMEIDTAMDEEDGEPKMESLKDFLAKTPKTNIDWGLNTTTTPSSAGTAGGATSSASRSRDRAGVRLCRLLIKTEKLNVDSAKEVQGMAGKYNLGGFIQTGKPGMIIVEGLEFN